MNLKEILYTCPNLNETEETKRMYRTTHGLTDPGEQTNRNYNWSVDKNKHTFGLPQEKEYNGTKKSLMTDLLEAQYPKTNIVTKRLEDYRKATTDAMGKTKYKGTLDPNLDEDFTFGVPSIKNVQDQWNIGKCLQGDVHNFNQTDTDLGRSRLHRSKLPSMQPKDFDPNKTFGVPSVRGDLPKKRNVSINDLNVKNIYFNLFLTSILFYFLFSNRIMEMKKMFLWILPEMSMKENLRIILWKVWARRLLLTEVPLKENTKRIRKTGKGDLYGAMVPFIKEV